MEKVAKMESKLGSLWARLADKFSSYDVDSLHRIIEMDVQLKAIEDKVKVDDIQTFRINKKRLKVR